MKVLSQEKEKENGKWFSSASLEAELAVEEMWIETEEGNLWFLIINCVYIKRERK